MKRELQKYKSTQTTQKIWNLRQIDEWFKDDKNQNHENLKDEIMEKQDK